MWTADAERKLVTVVEALGVEVSPAALAALRAYHELLVAAAERLNLVSAKSEEELVERHYLDSLKVVPLIEAYVADVRWEAGAQQDPPLLRGGNGGPEAGISADEDRRPGADRAHPGPGRLIDVGSGAGLPGMIVAIFVPWVRVVLLEATRKKCEFLRSAVDAIDGVSADAHAGVADAVTGAPSLQGRVEILCGRAETLGHEPDHREHYDVALARALAPLAELVEYALPFVRVGGVLFAHKGVDVDRELRSGEYAVGELGGGDPRVHHYGPPQWADPGTVIEIRKIAPTPDRYPRRPGIPKKRPIPGPAETDG
jgi:16S rRNA (guanine527-N7)-methyltransferase